MNDFIRYCEQDSDLQDFDLTQRADGSFHEDIIQIAYNAWQAAHKAAKEEALSLLDLL